MESPAPTTKVRNGVAVGTTEALSHCFGVRSMRTTRSLPRGEGLLGADDRVRTGDLNLGKVALYQLSHVRVNVRD